MRFPSWYKNNNAKSKEKKRDQIIDKMMHDDNTKNNLNNAKSEQVKKDYVSVDFEKFGKSEQDELIHSQTLQYNSPSKGNLIVLVCGIICLEDIPQEEYNLSKIVEVPDSSSIK